MGEIFPPTGLGYPPHWFGFNLPNRGCPTSPPLVWIYDPTSRERCFRDIPGPSVEFAMLREDVYSANRNFFENY